LTYTHGYGAVVSPVNRVTREGLPEFWVKDIPPVASSDLRISRPELYFSELATDYVFVKTRAKEFDYPAGDQNVYTTYGGQGGIPLESFWRKVLFAARLGDLKLLLSNDLTPESRVLLYRNIRERVQRIAPFFRYDDDPYMVISAAGRIVLVRFQFLSHRILHFEFDEFVQFNCVLEWECLYYWVHKTADDEACCFGLTIATALQVKNFFFTNFTDTGFV
jgi:hypothetical protein